MGSFFFRQGVYVPADLLNLSGHSKQRTMRCAEAEKGVLVVVVVTLPSAAPK